LSAVDNQNNAEQPIRLSKLMSQRGICSRREADRYIEQGLVLVDGEVVNQLGSKVLPTQTVTLLPAARDAQQSRVTILLNKPVGYVSAQAERGYQPAVRLVTRQNHYADDTSKRQFNPRMLDGLAPAGRLDIDSRGLLVLTQDGRIARQLIGAESEIEKDYLVWVDGEISSQVLEKLRHGLQLDGKPLKPATVRRLNPQRLRIILTEGRKRQIRRMCEAVGLSVTGLTRVRIGRVKLGDLPPGQWRFLGDDEHF
jgi:23S rRNA pseudouridine2604 synthase